MSIFWGKLSETMAKKQSSKDNIEKMYDALKTLEVVL